MGPLASCLTLVKQLKRLNANVAFGESSGRGIKCIIFCVCYDPHDACEVTMTARQNTIMLYLVGLQSRGITKQQVAKREMVGLYLTWINIHKTFNLLATWYKRDNIARGSNKFCEEEQNRQQIYLGVSDLLSVTCLNNVDVALTLLKSPDSFTGPSGRPRQAQVCLNRWF